MKPVRSVLLISFHFPPVAVSSGVQRLLGFARHLPAQGWLPRVLTADARAYPITHPEQLADIPSGLTVERAGAFDAARHLAIDGHHFDFFTLPDRWWSWWFSGVWRGLAMLRRQRADVIFSSFPIATAHLIALTLHRVSGTPWVADCRDSFIDQSYPSGRLRRWLYRYIESLVMRHCQLVVFTTQGTREMYRQRYPQLPAERFAVIENGYAESMFAETEALLARSREPATGKPVAVAQKQAAYPHRPIHLLHSGSLHPVERDPRCFFIALSTLKSQGVIEAKNFQVTLRATGSDEHHQALLDELGVADLVTLASTVSYRQALLEMLSADGLLLFQGRCCNHQVPAKLYEYLRAGKPILALTDERGDTAKTLKRFTSKWLSDLEQQAQIVSELRSFIVALRAGERPAINGEALAAAERRVASVKLARLFDSLLSKSTFE